MRDSTFLLKRSNLAKYSSLVWIVRLKFKKTRHSLVRSAQGIRRELLTWNLEPPDHAIRFHFRTAAHHHTHICKTNADARLPPSRFATGPYSSTSIALPTKGSPSLSEDGAAIESKTATQLKNRHRKRLTGARAPLLPNQLPDRVALPELKTHFHAPQNRIPGKNKVEKAMFVGNTHKGLPFTRKRKVVRRVSNKDGRSSYILPYRFNSPTGAP